MLSKSYSTLKALSCCSPRLVNMKKENIVMANVGEPTTRITRARAAACRATGGHSPVRSTKAAGSKAALDEVKNSAPVTAGVQHKRRAVLKDVTNVCCDSYKNCLIAAKISKKNSKPARKCSANVSKVAPSVAVQMQQLPAESKAKIAQETAKTEVECLVKLVDNIPCQTGITVKGCAIDKHLLGKQNTELPLQLKFSERDEVGLCGKLIASTKPDITNIDSDQKDSLLCTIYAPDIYSNLRVAEVSEEYKLVPDTIYLTVHLIDLFLSQNYIERQRLQLLGITCMFIASKYEEICAPRVEEFCFITDNTYSRGETPSLELEFLANYLAELTLVDYEFLKLLPSTIAASAVFLARWTLDQSGHPWNATLEHYTNYKASDLKIAVIALQGLQLNTNDCPLNAIRAKYRQDKYKSVAALSSPELLQTLF
ncbi:hypothetical protein HYC85_027005 [Camellia sinensis]|uniref:Cyclin N-terminal domain-containing protein n=1 Tax=Camellia sinensis TaxID=4442 RepID=A0A7J7G973_CAMSI|nr:hypothetical protein HYC85_027005 [Camellia sinensis]